MVPPNFHEQVIDVAIAHGVDVLCEKPIADTMAGSVRVARKIKEAGRKMAVTISHRFDQDKTTLRQIIRSGNLGAVNLVSCRYYADMRGHLGWGALFRHTMKDPLLIEGAVHHLDIVADFAGARCDTLFASTWKPDWAEYAGDTDGVVTMVFENGVRGIYEGSSSSATGLNDWSKEYIRIECENGTAILNSQGNRGLFPPTYQASALSRRTGAEDPPSRAAQVDQFLADRKILQLAGRRAGNGDDR